ncbi:N-acetylated-alpha-linked acidic dipeptidase-like protein [Armadillidium nasatum]|uniref:N-acetylated-alpha-linked acidic dipeptidase-like protein n=1 Tax=Armadillidium nasatum TaxID=96803 RepID=A0A5N5STN6_9CRUS|nr:N-acetylated-alpha-linked acidic dipeptidase-like protein [Armadillidium nasatum]
MTGDRYITVIYLMEIVKEDPHAKEILHVPPGQKQTITTTTSEAPESNTKDMTDVSQKYEIVLEDKWQKEIEMANEMIHRFNRDNMRENLRYLSEKPHMAATPRDNELAEHVKGKFEEAGFDSVELVPYNLYLSKPDPNNPNKITLQMNGENLFISNHRELEIHEGDGDPDFVDAFNAFTPAGTVSTEPGVGVVYVNYGRREDFEKLEELGINITGHIALVRYGKIYRGNKIRNAEQFGANGIIIFSDPEDVAADGIASENVYDHTWWLPGTGMQRGSTYLGDGDPLTPGWPSTEHAYRISEEESDLHKIPCQPIGYSDAIQILERLDGPIAPEDWQGGYPGFTYKLGPFFNSQNGSVSLTLSTHNSGKIERSFNVIGIIKGSIEPDRYVLIGNHRDAWGYGAADPSSGTAQLLETVRVYGTFLKEGWRPRRTIIFCSWGAEEFGLIGSTEWVEENINKLQSRAVAYINTDTCTSGPELHIRASPLMHDLFTNVTKMIPGVKDSSKTVYDEWKEYNIRFKPSAPEHPIIKALGSGSDYAPFNVYGGIPAADIWFRRDEVKYNITMYPFYHTGYETFYMVSNFIDPEFKIHEGCGRVASLAIKYLADSSIIPYIMMRGRRGEEYIHKYNHDLNCSYEQ